MAALSDLMGAAVRVVLAPVRFVADRVAMRRAGPLDDLAPGEGAIVDLEGRKVAAFRDEDGTIQAVSPVCTHLRCIVSFDDERREWACPCHGSRFGLDGEVLKGPAKTPLEKVSVG
ncbi:MAG: Rieske 2Fe-2S domain-containing protein [Actinomycetota bacterium]